MEGDLSEEQQQCLDGLKERINSAIELYEGDGALVKINGRYVSEISPLLLIQPLLGPVRVS